MKNSEWFANWFDTSYYHILYKNRNFEEAERFIESILAFLQPKVGAKILDLACGKGRHAYFMAKKGYEVKGLDLSEQSILWARQNFQLEGLSFDIHDMRKSYLEGGFDYVFNLFTSFGYFDDYQDNQKVIHAMKSNLNAEGIIVLDYMNAHFVKNNLVQSEERIIEGIHFKVSRELKNNFIIKHIELEDNEQILHFEERVQAFDLEDFKLFFEQAGLSIIATFGDYQLNEFNEQNSDRLILIARSNA